MQSLHLEFYFRSFSWVFDNFGFFSGRRFHFDHQPARHLSFFFVLDSGSNLLHRENLASKCVFEDPDRQTRERGEKHNKIPTSTGITLSPLAGYSATIYRFVSSLSKISNKKLLVGRVHYKVEPKIRSDPKFNNSLTQ